DAGYFTVSEGVFERWQIVEFDHLGCDRWIDGRADVAAPRAGGAIRMKSDEGFIDRAVVAPVEHQDFGTAGDLPRQADGEAAGIGSRADKGWESARPLAHPVHGHARQQRLSRTLEERLGLRAVVQEALLLAQHERGYLDVINGSHAIWVRVYNGSGTRHSLEVHSSQTSP